LPVLVQTLLVQVKVLSGQGETLLVQVLLVLLVEKVQRLVLMQQLVQQVLTAKVKVGQVQELFA